jgi:hypothetical protein
MDQEERNQRPIEYLVDRKRRLQVHPAAESQLAAERKSRPYVYYHQWQQQPTAQPGELQKVEVRCAVRHVRLRDSQAGRAGFVLQGRQAFTGRKRRGTEEVLAEVCSFAAEVAGENLLRPLLTVSY